MVHVCEIVSILAGLKLNFRGRLVSVMYLVKVVTDDSSREPSLSSIRQGVRKIPMADTFLNVKSNN